MADLNVDYKGYVEHFDRPTIKVCRGLMTPFGCIGPYEDEFLEEPENIVQWRDEFNKQSPATIAAVKVAYDKQTQTRLEWIRDRLEAIKVRVAFIKERTETFRQTLGQNGQLEASEKLGVTLATITPVVGAIFAPILGSFLTQSKREDLAYAQEVVSNYQTDATNLAEIKKQLESELPVAIATTDPTSEAPFAVSGWWYVAGIALLLLFFVWLKRRNSKRRRR